MKEKMTLKVYKHESNAGTSQIEFNSDSSGTLILEGGGEYSFEWDLNDELHIVFKNVKTTKAPDRWYDFRGTNGSSINKSCSFINLIIFDLDFENNTSLQFSTI